MSPPEGTFSITHTQGKATIKPGRAHVKRDHVVSWTVDQGKAVIEFADPAFVKFESNTATPGHPARGVVKGKEKESGSFKANTISAKGGSDSIGAILIVDRA